MKIIAITGTIGSGKGTVTEYLVNKKNYIHLSVRKYLEEILEKKGLQKTRKNMSKIANNLREKHESNFIIKELFKKANDPKKKYIIESIRTIGEIEFLKNKKNVLLLSIDADIKTRYLRILKRKSSTDNIDFQTFQQEEKDELYSKDKNKQNLLECIKKADIKITNNSNLKNLKKEIEKIFENKN